MIKLCKLCGKEFSGRPEKIFCNEWHRWQYHNQIKAHKKRVQKLKDLRLALGHDTASEKNEEVTL